MISSYQKWLLDVCTTRKGVNAETLIYISWSNDLDDLDDLLGYRNAVMICATVIGGKLWLV